MQISAFFFKVRLAGEVDKAFEKCLIKEAELFKN